MDLHRLDKRGIPSNKWKAKGTTLKYKKCCVHIVAGIKSEHSPFNDQETQM